MTETNRYVILKVRLTKEESDRLKERSERTGISMSGIVRAALKKQKLVELPPADFTETVVQLRRIGNNLNQLTRAANSGDVQIPEIKAALSELVLDDQYFPFSFGSGLFCISFIGIATFMCRLSLPFHRFGDTGGFFCFTYSNVPYCATAWSTVNSPLPTLNAAIRI